MIGDLKKIITISSVITVVTCGLPHDSRESLTPFTIIDETLDAGAADARPGGAISCPRVIRMDDAGKATEICSIKNYAAGPVPSRG